MKTLKRAPAVLFLTIIAVCTGAFSQGKKPQPKEGDVARGKYIVEDLVKCEQCHTPRDEQGNPDKGRWLMGGPLQIRATYPNRWASVTPRIAGQPPGTDAEIVKLLTTGIWKTGQPPNPPMPQFQMTQADAEAVVAYLKSLGR